MKGCCGRKGNGSLATEIANESKEVLRLSVAVGRGLGGGLGGLSSWTIE